MGQVKSLHNQPLCNEVLDITNDCLYAPVIIKYSQLSLSRTPLGPVLSVCLREMSVLLYRESNKGDKERQGPTLSVRFTEMSVL